MHLYQKLKTLNTLIFTISLSLLLGTPSLFAMELRTASIADMDGNVEVRIKNGGWQPAELGMILHENDEIRTAPNAAAELVLDKAGDTGLVEIKEASRLRINTLKRNETTGDKNTLLDLALGRVIVYAEELQGESTFEVRTPSTTAGVRGTIFEVAVEENI